jgi:broad specificity phosphatase PhoE
MEGHLDGEHTEKGQKQSQVNYILFLQLLAFRLSFATFSQIFSSDLERAKQTTKDILTYHNDTPVEYLSYLRERCLGNLEGKPLIALKNEALVSIL